MGNNNFRKMLDDRFGMFVHFGIYSAMEGFFEGKEVEGIGEWIQRNLEIPNEKYEAFGRKYFKPRTDFAKNLVAHAKKAGMRYIVLTSKHHDGFCLFKSDYSDYTTYNFFGRDIVKELADECKKEGLKLGLYYSHTLDWHEKDAGGNINSARSIPAKNRNYWDFPDENINFEKYFYEKCMPQVKELLTNYGELNLIWFDYPHNITKEQSLELRNLVKSIQPDCQINSRIAHNCNDYESLEDNTLPVAPVGENLECLVTLNDTWGYKKNDNNWKTPKEAIDILCRTLGSDSILLLNVGPMGDGSLTPETIEILEKMGEWTKRNDEAIYDNVTGNPFSNLFSWGYASKKENSIYLYAADKSKREIIINTGVKNTIKSISILGIEIKVDFATENGITKVTTIENDFITPVYKIEFENPPVFDNEIHQHGDVMLLGIPWAKKVKKGMKCHKPQKLVYEKSRYSEDYGTHGLSMNKNCQASFWLDSNEIICWEVNFNKPGKYNAYIINSYTYLQDNVDKNKEDTEDADCFILKVADCSSKIRIDNKGEVFYTSRTKKFNTKIKYNAGIFEIKAPGKHRILLERTKDGESIPVEHVEFIKV